ncbi:MAG: hypothetical protein J7J99_03970 [Thermoprotei archaeon]|nr:hypothetical protein [Thermoprotei archaeon]
MLRAKHSLLPLLSILTIFSVFSFVTNKVLCWSVEETSSFGVSLNSVFFNKKGQKFNSAYARDYVQEMLLPVPPSGYTVSSVYLKISFFKRIDLVIGITGYITGYYYKAVVNHIRIKKVELIIVGDDTPPYGQGSFKTFVFTLWSNIYGYGSRVVEGTAEGSLKRTVLYTSPKLFIKTVNFGKRIYVLKSTLRVIWTASLSLYIRWLSTGEAELNGGLIATVHTAVINVNYVRSNLHESYLEVCSWPISVPINGSGFSFFSGRFTNFTIVKKGEYTAFSETLYAPRYYHGFVFIHWIVGGSNTYAKPSLRLNVGDNKRIKVIAVYSKVSKEELVVIPGAHIPISLNLSDVRIALDDIRISLGSSAKWIKLHIGNSFVNSCYPPALSNIIDLPNSNIGVIALLYDPVSGTDLHDYWRPLIGRCVSINITVSRDRFLAPVAMFNINATVDDIAFQIDHIRYNDSGVEIIVIPYLAHSRVRFIDLKGQSSWYLRHLALALVRCSARYISQILWPLDDKGIVHIFLTYDALRVYMLNSLSDVLSHINFTMVEMYGNTILPVGLSDFSLELVRGSLIVDKISSKDNNLLIQCRMVVTPYNITLYGFHVKVLDPYGNSLGLWNDSDMDGSITICLRNVTEVVLMAYPPDELTANYIILPSANTVIKIRNHSRG